MVPLGTTGKGPKPKQRKREVGAVHTANLKKSLQPFLPGKIELISGYWFKNKHDPSLQREAFADDMFKISLPKKLPRSAIAKGIDRLQFRFKNA